MKCSKSKQHFGHLSTTLGVEPTNNLAERVLRKMVIWRKVCFGTWSGNGSRYLEQVMTVVVTCRLQERSVFQFLRESMEAKLNATPSPSLLPTFLSADIQKSVFLEAA